MILVSTPRNLKKAILVKELFYVSTMKGINNKIRIPCGNSHFQRSSIIVVQNFLKERKLTSSLLKEIAAFRGTIRKKHYISKNKRSHHEPAYHDHRYYNLLTLPILSTKTGQWLKIVAIKRQGVSSRANLFSKSVNQVNDCVINWPPNQDIFL